MPVAKIHSAVIADAFERVSVAAEYRSCWIAAYDFANILNYEHDISSHESKLDSVALVRALVLDYRFKSAEDKAGTTNGVFRKKYSPQYRADGSENKGKGRQEIHCYFVVNSVGSLPPKPPPGIVWYDEVVNLSSLRQKRCAIPEEKKRELAATPLLL